MSYLVVDFVDQIEGMRLADDVLETADRIEVNLE
jgi:hypothetical protein